MPGVRLRTGPGLVLRNLDAPTVPGPAFRPARTTGLARSLAVSVRPGMWVVASIGWLGVVEPTVA